MKALYQKYKPHYSESLKLAIPVVITSAGHMLTQMSDSILVGKFVGTIALAGVALANNFFIIVMVMGMGIAYGITPLVAQANGSKNYNECGRLLINSLVINVIGGVIISIIIFYGFDFAVPYLHQSPLVVSQARPFLRLLGFSMIPMLVFNTFKQFAEGLGFTKQAMKISIWGNVINIILGVIFVKGWLGIPPMGIRGAGLSTLIDRCIMAVVIFFYILRSRHFEKYVKGFHINYVNAARCTQLFKIGLPVAFQFFFEVSAFCAAGFIIGAIGPVHLAAHQVALTLASLTYMMANGVAAAAAIKSGNHFGAKNYPGLRLSAISSYHLAIVLMSITALIFTFGNHLLPWLFTSDKQVIFIAAQLLIIAAIFQLFDGTQVIGLGILRGMGDVSVPAWITFLAYWILGVPVGYLLGIYYHLGVNGVWYGLTLGLFTASLLLFLRFQRMSQSRLKI